MAKPPVRSKTKTTVAGAKPTSKKSGPMSGSRSDRELAVSALKKTQDGRTPNQSERRALARMERQREEEARRKHYETISIKDWVKWSGRPHQVLYKQDETYGIPFGRSIISLPEVVRALHDFLGKNAAKLKRETDEDLLFGEGGPSLDRLRLAKAKLAELELAERMGQLLPRDKVHDRLGQMAAILRRGGELLQRQCGNDAHRIHEEALDECDRHIEEWLGEKAEG